MINVTAGKKIENVILGEFLCTYFYFLVDFNTLRIDLKIVITLTWTYENQGSILSLYRSLAHKTVLISCFRIHGKHM